MQIISIRDNLHEMLDPVVLENKEIITKNFYPEC